MKKNIIDRILARIPSYMERMTRISMDIASQIYEYMKEADMSQRQLAEKLGKKESEISKWLSGDHNFTIQTVAKIEDIFEKNIILVPKYAEEDIGINYEIPNIASFRIDVEDIVRSYWNDMHFLSTLPNERIKVLEVLDRPKEWTQVSESRQTAEQFKEAS